MKTNKWLAYLAAFALIGVVLYFTKDQWQYFARIKDVSLQGFMMISIYFVVSQIIHALQLQWYMKTFKIHMSLNEAFGLICVRSFGNYLPMSGGVISNIVYLKKKRDLPVARYMSYIVGDTILKFCIFGVLGLLLLGGMYMYDPETSVNWLVLGFLALMLGISAIAIFFPETKKTSDNKIIEWFINMHRGWAILKKNNNLMFKNTLTHIIILVLIALQFYVIFREIHIEISFAAVLVLTIITNVIKISSLFPGNLGLRETISGGVTNVFGFAFASGFAASLLGRAVSIIWVCLFGIYYSFSFAHNLRK